MIACAIPDCPRAAVETVRIRRPGWRVPEARPLCAAHAREAREAGLEDRATGPTPPPPEPAPPARKRPSRTGRCAVPGCDRTSAAASGRCAAHHEVARALGWTDEDPRDDLARIEAARSGTTAARARRAWIASARAARRHLDEVRRLRREVEELRATAADAARQREALDQIAEAVGSTGLDLGQLVAEVRAVRIFADDAQVAEWALAGLRRLGEAAGLEVDRLTISQVTDADIDALVTDLVQGVVSRAAGAAATEAAARAMRGVMEAERARADRYAEALRAVLAALMEG